MTPRHGLWYLSAVDAARNTNTPHSTLLYALNRRRIPGAYRDEETGQWRIPVEGLLAADYPTTGEGAHRIGPLDHDPRAQSLHDDDDRVREILDDNADLRIRINSLLVENNRLRELLTAHGIDDPTVEDPDETL